MEPADMKPSDIIALANKDLYEHDYENVVMLGGKLNRWVYRMTHQELEKFKMKEPQNGISILELGAQADQHRSWVKSNYQSYIVSDIDLNPLLKSKAIYEKYLSEVDLKTAINIPEIKFEQINAEQIEYPDETFDRLIATCLIVHLGTPIDALYEWRRVTKDGGQIDFYVPCEPGLILRTARNLTHKRKKLNVEFPYDLLHYSQHRNHFLAIEEFIKYVFEKDSVTRRFFPFNFLSWGFNLWAVYSIQINKSNSI
jgi:phosphatidylethanolamine/phosphatidyl-N-methylethanolamine N-methyltransferase